jgi:hypothetical protein
MPGPYVTKKATKNGTSSSLIPVLQFNRDANSCKTMDTFGSVATYLGAINATPVPVPPNTPVIVMNSAGSIAWFAFGTSDTMTAPTGFGNAIMLPPNSTLCFASGKNTWIQGSAATVGAATCTEQILPDLDEQQVVPVNTNPQPNP